MLAEPRLLEKGENLLGLGVGLGQYRDTRLGQDLRLRQVCRFSSEVSVLDTRPGGLGVLGSNLAEVGNN